MVSMSLGTLDGLAGDLDVLVDLDPDQLADPETLVVLHRQQARLDAVVAGADAAFDTKREWAADEARSAAAWLSYECHLPKTETRRSVRLGRSLRVMPVCQQAWLDGTISAAHVRELCAARTPVTQDQFAIDEKMLVDAAQQLTFDKFCSFLAYWMQHADPDGADDTAEEQHANRKVFLSESIGGMWFGNMTFDPISGTIVNNELSRLEKELFDADWAKAKLRLGHEPTLDDLCRTPAQRRADALLE